MRGSLERDVQSDSPNLGWGALKRLKQGLWKTVLIEHSNSQTTRLRADKLIAIAWILSERISKRHEKRVGIVLPPGRGSWIANLAIAFAGKSSVNLNFTASRKAIENAICKSDLKVILTAEAMREKFSDFPWTPEVWCLEKLKDENGMKAKILGKLFLIHILPTRLLANAIKIKRNEIGEATLLFSSGSTGVPKGVPLTHENIHANVEQIAAIGLLPPTTRLLACLPIFHSFGLTVTLWYPLCHPMTVIASHNPIDTTAIANAVKDEKATLLLGTATFLRLYMRHIPREKFSSLKAVVAGAEKTPRGLHQKWMETFGNLYLEGYGLTETSPVVSVNLPHDNKIGTVGKPVAGMQARVVDIANKDLVLNPGERGILELKGKNIFSGYLDDEAANREVFHDGWFWTGDVGSITEDGRLVVEGRLRRFSKIGGEMVPHGAIEEALAACYEWHEHMPAAVTGIFDEEKGETLVLISEQKIDMNDLRQRLQKHGLPNLWIPKRIVLTNKLPYLPTGKLDLQKLGELGGNK